MKEFRWSRGTGPPHCPEVKLKCSSMRNLAIFCHRQFPDEYLKNVKTMDPQPNEQSPCVPKNMSDSMTEAHEEIGSTSSPKPEASSEPSNHSRISSATPDVSLGAAQIVTEGKESCDTPHDGTVKQASMEISHHQTSVVLASVNSESPNMQTIASNVTNCSVAFANVQVPCDNVNESPETCTDIVGSAVFSHEIHEITLVKANANCESAVTAADSDNKSEGHAHSLDQHPDIDKVPEYPLTNQNEPGAKVNEPELAIQEATPVIAEEVENDDGGCRPQAKRIKMQEAEDVLIPTEAEPTDLVESEEIHQQYDPRWDNDFSRVPRLLSGAYAPFRARKDNVVRGCKWSPDGSCLATASEDNCLRLFNLPPQICQLELDDIPEMPVALKVSEGELIYDYCWLPAMSSAQPETCRLLCTSRDAPVHMWDAYTGELAATYLAYDHIDELASSISLCISPDSRRLYSGYNKMIRVHDIERPGRQCQSRPTFVKAGQAGLISCIDVNPADPSMYAAGSYSRTVAVYTEPKGSMTCMFQGQSGGVTQVKFSPDGTKLYSGGRKDSEILCWDMRNPGHVLYTLNRDVSTNLRMHLDLDYSGRYLVSGNDSGLVTVWDTLATPVTMTTRNAGQGLAESESQSDCEPLINPHLMYPAHNDCVNGISLHPTMPLLATSSGQRHIRLPKVVRRKKPETDDSQSEVIDPKADDSLSEDSDREEEEVQTSEASLKLWWIGRHASGLETG